MDCEKVKSFLYDFAEGEVKAPDREMTEEHLKACPSCQKELSDIVRITRALTEFAEVDEPPDFLQQVRERIRSRQEHAILKRLLSGPSVARVLVPVGCLILVGFGVWLAYKEFSPPPGQMASYPAKKGEKPKVIARAYDTEERLAEEKPEGLGRVAFRDINGDGLSEEVEGKEEAYYAKRGSRAYKKAPEVPPGEPALGVAGGVMARQLPLKAGREPAAADELGDYFDRAKTETEKGVVVGKAYVGEKEAEKAEPPLSRDVVRARTEWGRAEGPDVSGEAVLKPGAAEQEVLAQVPPASERARRATVTGHAVLNGQLRRPADEGEATSAPERPEVATVTAGEAVRKEGALAKVPSVAVEGKAVALVPEEETSAYYNFDLRTGGFVPQVEERLEKARRLEEAGEELPAYERQAGASKLSSHDKGNEPAPTEDLSLRYDTAAGIVAEAGQKALGDEVQSWSLAARFISLQTNGSVLRAYGVAGGAVPVLVMTVKDRQKALAEIKKTVTELGGTIEPLSGEEYAHIQVSAAPREDVLVVKLKAEAYQSLLGKMGGPKPSSGLADMKLDLGDFVASTKAVTQHEGFVTFLIRLVEVAEQKQQPDQLPPK